MSDLFCDSAFKFYVFDIDVAEFVSSTALSVISFAYKYSLWYVYYNSSVIYFATKISACKIS